MGNVTCAQCSKLTANHAICDECFAKAEKLQGHLDSEQRQSARRIREMLEENARLETIVEDRNKRVAEVNARIAEWDRLLRASVPERWKNCTSPVGSVQSYIAELEYDIRDQDRRISIYLSKSDCRKVKHIAKLEALVRRAARDSVVTTADDPGCFYCDRSGPHAPDCPAGAALDEERDRGR